MSRVRFEDDQVWFAKPSSHYKFLESITVRVVEGRRQCWILGQSKTFANCVNYLAKDEIDHFKYKSENCFISTFRTGTGRVELRSRDYVFFIKFFAVKLSCR